MTSSCPEDQGQMDFFGVSEAPPQSEAPAERRRTHAQQTTVPTLTADEPIRRPPQLSWLPDVFTWSDRDCFAMMEGLLIDQLRLLADGRTAPEVQAEIIAWVAEPKRNLAALKNAPFSFQACCAAAGVDFEEMRERTLRMFAPHLIAQLD